MLHDFLEFGMQAEVPVKKPHKLEAHAGPTKYISYQIESKSRKVCGKTLKVKTDGCEHSPFRSKTIDLIESGIFRSSKNESKSFRF